MAASKTRSQVIQDAAKAEAQRLKALVQSGPKMLSEADQLKQYQDRLSQGHQGFQDIFDQHGPQGLGKYLSAMDKLQRRKANGRGVPQ